MTIEKLLAFEEFPEKLTGILSALVKSRYNILISGATNSGKSSLLNALAEYIGKRERVITIEDSAELQLFHVENLVRLETRNANMEGENEITMQDLIKASLRMRPDRIIVGEVRGAEAMSMLQALSTGHSGSVSSITCQFMSRCTKTFRNDGFNGNGYASCSNTGIDCFFSRHSHSFRETYYREKKDIRDMRN